MSMALRTIKVYIDNKLIRIYNMRVIKLTMKVNTSLKTEEHRAEMFLIFKR